MVEVTNWFHASWYRYSDRCAISSSTGDLQAWTGGEKVGCFCQLAVQSLGDAFPGCDLRSHALVRPGQRHQGISSLQRPSTAGSRQLMEAALVLR